MKKNNTLYLSLVLTIVHFSTWTANANQSIEIKSVDSKNVVLGYMSFSKYNSYSLEDIHFDKLTHIVQSFMCPVSATDPKLKYIGDETIFSRNQELSEKSFLGYGSQLVAEANRKGVKVLLGISGGTKLHAKDLKVIFNNHKLRKQFIRNLIEICEKRGYNGVDLDYEYAESISEKEGISKFITELREGFNQSPRFSKRKALITMACPKFDNYGQWYDFTLLSKFCDWFNIMTYAYEANFTKLAGFNCPLFPEQAAININRGGSVSSSMVDYFVKERGIKPQQLVLGLAFFGWLHQDYSGLYKAKSQSTGLSYAEISRNYINKPDWIKNWSDVAQVPYLTNVKTNQMISYDDEESIKLKCNFAQQQGFKGVMIWELSRGFLKNSDHSEPLLNAIAESKIGLRSK